MKKIVISKVKQTLSKMDDKYWEDLTAKCSELNKRLPEILEEFTDNCTKLTIAQMNILEAKYNGYQKLIECRGKSAQEQVAGENKAHISDLSHNKCQILDTLSVLIIDMHVVVEEIDIMGKSAFRSD